MGLSLFHTHSHTHTYTHTYTYTHTPCPSAGIHQTYELRAQLPWPVPPPRSPAVGHSAACHFPNLFSLSLSIFFQTNRITRTHTHTHHSNTRAHTKICPFFILKTHEIVYFASSGVCSRFSCFVSFWRSPAVYESAACNTATYSNMLQHTATHAFPYLLQICGLRQCSILQHTATHCNTVIPLFLNILCHYQPSLRPAILCHALQHTATQ